MGKTALVVHGPSVWREQHGAVTRETEDFVWLNLIGQDDAKDGKKTYEVSMPKLSVIFDPEEDHST